jgi:hypothetical protein
MSKRLLLHYLYRVAQFALIVLLVYGLAQTLPLDLAWLFAGDLMTYFEVAAAVWLASQVTRLRWAVAYARLALRPHARLLRRRARRGARRLARLAASKSADDDGRGGALAPA